MRVLVVDALGRGSGKRVATVDVIGTGPRIVYTVFKRMGLEVELTTLERALEMGRSIARRFDVLAVSFMVGDERGVKKLLDLWLRSRGKHVVLGGPGTLNKEFLRSIRFSIAICGEIEVVAKAIEDIGGLEKALENPLDLVQRVSGVYTKQGNEVIGSGIAPHTPREILAKIRPDPEAIKSYPFYWACRVYVEVVRGCSNYLRPLETSDGRRCIVCGRCSSRDLRARLECPSNIPPGCGYCNVPLLFGPPRSIPIDAIYREVRKLVELGATRIVLSAPDFLDYGRDLLVDPEPLTDPREPPPNIDEIERLLKTLTSIEQVADGVVSIAVENVKACLVNEYVAEVLGRYLRGSVIYIGLESGDNDLLRRVGRPCTVEECLRAIDLLRRYGLRPYVYLMHGIPGETDDSLRKSIEVVDKLENLGVEKIVLYRFRPLPGSAFEKAPRPLPAIKRPVARELYERVKMFNESRKNELVGKIVRVVIACPYPKKSGYLVSYPLYHGPVVLVRASRRFIGCIADVRIERVLSERIVEGKLLYTRRRLPIEAQLG